MIYLVIAFFACLVALVGLIALLAYKKLSEQTTGLTIDWGDGTIDFIECVEPMKHAFRNCPVLVTIPDLDISNVKSFANMFDFCQDPRLRFPCHHLARRKRIRRAVKLRSKRRRR